MRRDFLQQRVVHLQKTTWRSSWTKSRRNKVSIGRNNDVANRRSWFTRIRLQSPWQIEDFPKKHEEIRELKMNNIALKGSLNDTETSLDHVTLCLDRCAAIFAANSGNAGSCDCFTVSRGIFKTQNLQTARFRDELSTVLWIATTSLRHRFTATMLPMLSAAMFLSRFCSGRQFQFFFTGAGCQASREPFCFIDRSKSNCSLPIAKQKEPRPTKKAWRSRTPVVERNRGLTDWRLVPQKSRRLPKSDFATSSGPTNSFDIRISKNVRIWRVTQKKGQVRTREISHVFNVQLLAVELWNRSLFSCLPCIWDDVVDARNRGCSGYRRLEKVLLVYSETVSRLRDAARQDRNHIIEHLGELELQEQSVCGRAGNPSRQSISLRTTFACMIHEHFRITGTHDKCLKNYLILSGSLSEETTFKDSIHSETKFSHLLEKLPRMTHWKVCTENLEIRNNWRPHLHCTIEIPYRRMNQRATHA